MVIGLVLVINLIWLIAWNIREEDWKNRLKRSDEDYWVIKARALNAEEKALEKRLEAQRAQAAYLTLGRYIFENKDKLNAVTKEEYKNA